MNMDPKDRLWNLIPDVYRYEGNELEPLVRSGFGSVLADLENRIKDMTRLIDVDRCPDKYLPYLAALTNVPLVGSNPISWRRQIRNWPWLLRFKGTKRSIEVFVDSLGFKDYEIRTWFRDANGGYVQRKPSGQPFFDPIDGLWKNIRTHYFSIIMMVSNDELKSLSSIWSDKLAEEFEKWFEFAKPYHAEILDLAIVGLSERMLQLNTCGPVATEIIDLSYTERQNHIVYTGSRLSSPGNIEIITTDASLSETISYPLFIGSRLNGKTGFKLNKNDITSALNNAPLLVRTKTVTNTATTTRKRFVNSAFLLNARGVYTSTMVDIGRDELVTEVLFTDGTLNSGKITVSVTTDTEIKAGTRINLAGYRLNGKLQEPRLNRSQPVITATTITENKVNTIKRLNASVFSLCSNKTLNNSASYSRQTIVHHPDWQPLIKTEGGHLLNNAPSRTETVEILHPGSKICKKFNPEIGTVLNGKPTLGYRWKIYLKEAI